MPVKKEDKRLPTERDILIDSTIALLIVEHCLSVCLSVQPTATVIPCDVSGGYCIDRLWDILQLDT